MVELPADMLGISIQKYNQNHGADGRFSSGAGGAASGGKKAKPSVPHGAHAAAVRVHAHAKVVEPQLTAAMGAVAAQHDLRLEGLDFRLKAPDSLARKIAEEAEVAGISHEDAANAVSDSVRYTAMIPTERYTAGINASLETLRAKGYKTRVKNYWQHGDPYQGVNVALTAPDGTAVELQFHTPDSLNVKNKNHGRYEVYRESPSNDERLQLWDLMTATAATAIVPPDVLTISELRQQHHRPVVE